MKTVLQLCFQDAEEQKFRHFFFLMQPFFLTFKEGPAQPPQGIALQNLRKVLCIKVEKALTKARGKKIFVCLLSRGL